MKQHNINMEQLDLEEEVGEKLSAFGFLPADSAAYIIKGLIDEIEERSETIRFLRERLDEAEGLL